MRKTLVLDQGYKLNLMTGDSITTKASPWVVQAIADGIKRAGSEDPKAIAEALKDFKPADTVLGPVRFDAKRDVLDPRYDINMWSAGKYWPIAT
jgi:branched-chain amino acid transport system substrate-binding protein